MRKRIIAGCLMLIAVGFSFDGLELVEMDMVDEAEARGGRGGGGRGGGGRGGMGRGGGRSGRGGMRRFGRGRGGASGNTAKEWQLLIEQEERLELIAERRNLLMEGDRAAEQEAWLRERRGDAADTSGQTGTVR